MTYVRSFTVALLSLLALAALATPRAFAISDAEELWQAPAVASVGSGAGQLFSPFGVASDPVNGHVYVVEAENRRISEFTAWGNFVKAFGWDVAPGAVNEQQEVRVRAATGQFKLGFGAATTTDLPFNATGPEVEAALNALASIGGAGGSASVSAVPGTTDGKTPYVYAITFKGSLAATDVAQLVTSNGSTPLGGGDPEATLEARTRADGHAPTTGLEACTAESGCKAGVSGGGSGQLKGPREVAVDKDGNVYVKEVGDGAFGNLRVQKFDSAGRFVLMFGGGVNQTTGEDVCTKASGDVCKAGSAGSGPGEFASNISTDGVALCPRGRPLCPNGALFVADVERIQRFSLEGAFEAQLPVSGEVVVGVAFDPVGEDLYATYSGKPNFGAQKLDGVTGAPIGAPVTPAQGLVATDEGGNLYARSGLGVAQYDAAGKPLAPSCCEGSGVTPNSLGTNKAGDLHVAYSGIGGVGLIRAFGPPPVRFEGPPPVPPQITDQYATSVDRGGAVVRAEINPRFWVDTRFHVQYGTGKCSEGGCVETKPLPPGALLGTKAVAADLRTPGVFLEELKPGTTYHYRFVAESSGGGPVRGIGGTPEVDGEEGTFTTYPATAPFKSDCPNQRFRTGPSAPLPDCRAYEMVSPIEKNNGDIKALLDLIGFPTSLEQSSTGGGRFTYSSYRAFADPKAGAYAMQYLASRKDGVGWSSEAIMPPQGHAAAQEIADLLTTYKAFSPDLCQGWLGLAAEPPLPPVPTEGYRNLYRRDNCGGGGYQALNAAAPTIAPKDFFPEFQGASADGAKAVFRVRDKLTVDAASNAWLAYYASEGELRLLCVLPNGAPAAGNCSAGTGGSGDSSASVSLGELNRVSSIRNAVSADGAHVYWTASDVQSGPGKVYLRLNPGEEQSALSGGECTEAEKACTLRVSETVSTRAARFLGATPEGSRALFEITEGPSAGNLYRFDIEAGGSTLIAGKALGLLGASEDLSRVYFVSEEALAGDAQAGKPNLYLAEGAMKTFIATLSKADVAVPNENGTPVNTAAEPIYRASRVSPDGSHLAFISTESLTGYDNTDQVSGEADSEVYRYEAGASGPVCVSCNPSGARPIGRRLKLYLFSPKQLPASATLPVAQSMHYLPRSLSADGQHLFFTAYEALLPRDTNGKADVYQWEAASGPADCKAIGAELWVPSSGGCLSLISSGQSPEDSTFLDASADGSDVFFATSASLLPQDPGLIDVYDARAGGGLPGPPEPPGPCQGEACQPAPPPPSDPTPASASFKGAGNPSAKAPPRRRCAKGKARRKGRCVAKKRKGAKGSPGQRARTANRNRGAHR